MLRSQQTTLVNQGKEPKVKKNKEKGATPEEGTDANSLGVTVRAGSRYTARDFRMKKPSS